MLDELTRDGQGDATAILDDSPFYRYFMNQPGPAYLWQEVHGDFRLLAHNHAAEAIPFSRIGLYVGSMASELFTDHPTVVPDLMRCNATAAVVIREVDFLYTSTQSVRRLVMTFVPVTRGTVVIHTEDITERKQAERALAASERQYRTIVDTANEGVWQLDANGVTTFVNRQLADMLGYTPDDMLGRHLLDFVEPNLQAEAARNFEMRREHITDQHDFRFQRRDGTPIWTRVAATPLFDEDANFVGALGMVADISTRKNAEQALLDSDRRLRALLDTNPDVILRMDVSGRYIDVHAGESTEFPFMPDELIGRSIGDIYGEDAQQAHEHWATEAVATGQVQFAEFSLPIGGRNLYLEARYVRSGDDEVVVNVRDITERVRLERELTIVGERAWNRIGREIHDGLAQNLAGAKLLLEALALRLDDGASGAVRAEVDRGVALLDQTIRQARELARGLSPVPEATPLFEALHELARTSESVFGIRCLLDLSGAPDAIDEAAKAHIYRIAQEAITNAVKHGGAREIAISCATSSSRLELSIVDDGSGFSGDEDREGLGLRIMRHRARSLGGVLEVRDRPAGGAIVACSCPVSALIAGDG